MAKELFTEWNGCTKFEDLCTFNILHNKYTMKFFKLIKACSRDEDRGSFRGLYLITEISSVPVGRTHCLVSDVTLGLGVDN